MQDTIKEVKEAQARFKREYGTVGSKGDVFAKHIKDHLKDGELPHCKICGMNIDEIYDKALWANNTVCPNCGDPADQNIRAAETGYSYCTGKCASEHVKANAPPGGY